MIPPTLLYDSEPLTLKFCRVPVDIPNSFFTSDDLSHFLAGVAVTPFKRFLISLNKSCFKFSKSPTVRSWSLCKRCPCPSLFVLFLPSIIFYFLKDGTPQKPRLNF